MIDPQEKQEGNVTTSDTTEESELTDLELRKLNEQAINNWQRVAARLVAEGKLDPDDFAQENQRVMSSLRKRAETDPLTGLSNAKGFENKLEELIEKGEPFGLLVIDANKLKKINDTYGHIEGDKVIAQIGFKLSGGVRLERGEPDVDFIARYGGDEFMVLLPNVSDENHLEQIAKKLCSKFQKNDILVNNKESKDEYISVTLSIGGGICGEKVEPRLFVKSVDEAQYQAKELAKAQDSKESIVVILRQPERQEQAA